MEQIFEIAQVGRPAPAFETQGLVGDKIQQIALSDYMGKWVMLFFYPGDFTFVCPTELVSVAERYMEFQACGVEVLAISVDSPHVHKAWQEHELSKMIEGGLPYPMLSDRAGHIGERYLVYDPEEGVDIRGFFIVDPEGHLRYISVNVGIIAECSKSTTISYLHLYFLYKSNIASLNLGYLNPSISFV